MRASIASLLVVASLAVACGKSDDHAAPTGAVPTSAATTAAPSAAATPAATPSAPPSAAPAAKVDLAVTSVANTMAFDKTKLTVPTGATVHLTFKNSATMVLPHNWVLVKPGTEAAVAAAGLKMGEPAGYLDVRDKDILANTDMAKAGESTDVTFTAPAPGDYPYICSFPGHYLLMKGVLTVTP